MTPAAVLALLYPYLAAEADPRFAPETDRDVALTLAASFRPSCLPGDAQDVAQAHYAAHLLGIAYAGRQAAGSTTTVEALAGGQITEISEGSVSIKYAPPTAAKTTTSSIASAGTPTTSISTASGLLARAVSIFVPAAGAPCVRVTTRPGAGPSADSLKYTQFSGRPPATLMAPPPRAAETSSGVRTVHRLAAAGLSVGDGP